MRKESQSRESNLHRPLSTSPTPYHGAKLTHKPSSARTTWLLLLPRQNTRQSARPCYCLCHNNLLTYSQGKTQGGVLDHLTASARTSWLCYIQPRQNTRHSTRPCYCLGHRTQGKTQARPCYCFGHNNLAFVQYSQGITQSGMPDHVTASTSE